MTGAVQAATIRRRIRIPLRFADGYSTTATVVSFTGLTDAQQHVALELGRPAAAALPLVRLHSECLTGDVFGSQRCDCGPQLREAVERITQHGGYLLYLRQEGRGIGLYDKLDAYALQDGGLDTYDANLALGHKADERDYTSAAQMLHALGADHIVLLSNNPDKGAQLARLGITIASQVPTALHLTGANAAYLVTKARRGGHDPLSRSLDAVNRPDRWTRWSKGAAVAAGYADGGAMRAVRPAVESPADESPADESPVRADRPVDRGTIRLATILGVLSTAALLGVVSVAAGLGSAGWIAGLATGWAATALIVTARMRSDEPAILPADWVTLTRAVLCAGVAGLVADSFGRPVSITALVALSAAALALDAVDGQVARRTGTVTSLGARFDGEVDAFLILLLSIVVSQAYGSWVLVIGAARYALLLAGWLILWLAAPLPPRYWRKVVAAVQGIVLTIAASGLVDRLTGMIAVAAAMLLLAESFGRDVIWLYRTGAGPRTRLALRLAVAVLAIALVWSDLLAPDRAWQFTPAAFVRIPLEGLVLVAVALVLPPRPRRIVAAVAGILLGVLTFAKILNMAFYEFADRAFNPVFDWGSIGSALGAVRDAIGPTGTDIALAALGLGLILLVSALTAATIHITAVAARHRRAAVRGLGALAAVWAVCAGLSLQLIPGFPVASTSAAGLAVGQVRATQAAFRDQRLFEQTIHSPDPEARIPAPDLLTGLGGKDVVIAFVESYGQVSLQDPTFSPGIDAVLRRADASLTRAGWSTQSAWVTAPSYGGTSQLAHSTLQAGVWVDSTQRYAELIGTSRFTLSDAFDKAGWHTVSDSPTNGAWPPGKSFYHFDQLLGRYNVGYQGPTFSYSPMPDQYALAAFQRLELAPGHKPVMAEIDLTSSHWPWAPLPTMVPWNKVGDGSIFDPMPAKGPSRTTVERNANLERQFYGTSMQYTMQVLTSWVTQLNDPNLVLILLGDEQPDTPISTPGQASHEVPISIIAHDPSVFRQIASWRWQDGLLPGRSAPLEPMSAFRNQFLDAFSTAPSTGALAPGLAASGTATVSETPESVTSSPVRRGTDRPG